MWKLYAPTGSSENPEQYIFYEHECFFHLVVSFAGLDTLWIWLCPLYEHKYTSLLFLVLLSEALLTFVHGFELMFPPSPPPPSPSPPENN